MDVALTRARASNVWLAPAFVASGALIGAAAWVGLPATLPLAFLFPAVWSFAPNRSIAGGTAFAYYAAASRGVPVGAEVFFENGVAYAVALWIGASLLLALPWYLLFGRRWRALRAVLAILLVAVPPIGIVGWAHPITGIGDLLPAAGWAGLAAGLVGLSLAARWPVIALGMTSVALLLPRAPIEAPEGWRGITTHWRLASSTHDLVEQHKRLRSLAGLVTDNTTDRVLIFPETILGTWLAPSSWLWADTARLAQAREQTLVFGAEWLAGSHYENIAGVMTPHGSLAPVYRQRMPVPFSMWRPGTGSGAIPAWFEAQTATIDGRKTAFLICYEQLLIWPPLVAFSSEPEVLVGMSNDWWARDTNIPAIQRMTMAAWARLFDVPLVLAENL